MGGIESKHGGYVRLLVAEHHLPLAKMLQKALCQDGYTADLACTEGQLLKLAGKQSYDLLIFGLGSTADACAIVLQRFLDSFDDLPVIVISNDHEAQEQLRALYTGVSGFLIKPMCVQDLLAKIRVVLHGKTARVQDEELMAIGPIRLYPQFLTATMDEQPVALTHREYQLLELLMRKRNQVLSRTQLEGSLYASDENVGSNAIEVYVHQLRRKLYPEVINTIRGVGYQLAPSLLYYS